MTVTKRGESEEWALIKPSVFATLMDYLQSGRTVLNLDETDADEKITDTSMVFKV